MTKAESVAEELLKEHASDIRYCEVIGRWIYWDRTAWRQDAHGHVMRLIKLKIRDLHLAGFESREGRKAIEAIIRRSAVRFDPTKDTDTQ